MCLLKNWLIGPIEREIAKSSVVKLDSRRQIGAKLVTICTILLILLTGLSATAYERHGPTNFRVSFKNESRVKMKWKSPLAKRYVKKFLIFRNDVYLGSTRKTSYVDYVKTKGYYRYKVVTEKWDGNLTRSTKTLKVRFE